MTRIANIVLDILVTPVIMDIICTLMFTCTPIFATHNALTLNRLVQLWILH